MRSITTSPWKVCRHSAASSNTRTTASCAQGRPRRADQAHVNRLAERRGRAGGSYRQCCWRCCCSNMHRAQGGNRRWELLGAPSTPAQLFALSNSCCLTLPYILPFHGARSAALAAPLTSLPSPTPVPCRRVSRQLAAAPRCPHAACSPVCLHVRLFSSTQPTSCRTACTIKPPQAWPALPRSSLPLGTPIGVP